MLATARAVRRWFGDVGLGRRRTVLKQRLRRARERVTLARETRNRTRIGMLRWKEKYRLRKERDNRQAPDRVSITELQREVTRLAAALRASEQARSKAVAELNASREFIRVETVKRMEAIEALISDAERSVRSGRGQLDAVEAKLDLVDGAINTLDQRYRTIAVRDTLMGN